MATLNSNLVQKRTRHRGIYAGQDYDVAGRIFLAAGTVLATGDTLLFIPVGEQQVIQKVSITSVGDTGPVAGSIGRFQILGPNGQPARVERRGPEQDVSDYAFTSPADAPTLYKAAGQLDGYAETIVATPEKLAGPVNVGIRITTGGTIAADTELFLAAYFKGETSTREVNGFGSDAAYLLSQTLGVSPH